MAPSQGPSAHLQGEKPAPLGAEDTVTGRKKSTKEYSLPMENLRVSQKAADPKRQLNKECCCKEEDWRILSLC